jgi:hypothetical protein
MNTCDDRTIEDVISGRHRWAVIHGDCLDVMRTMPGCCVDAVVTDAPYGLSEIDDSDVRSALECWINRFPYVHSMSPSRRGRRRTRVYCASGSAARAVHETSTQHRSHQHSPSG